MNINEIEAALLKYESDSWRAEAFKLIRLELILNLEGDEFGNDFIMENLQFPKIREIAYNKAIAAKNYEQGERLCLDALSTYEQRYGISPWLYKLYDTHVLMENSTKISETAKKLLLSGDMEYYDKLKSQLKEQAAWDGAYAVLLDECKSNLSPSGYMEILEKENEYALLLEQAEKHTREIYCHGEFLAREYPSQVCSIFTTQLIKEAESAYGRESYGKVCAHIVLFANAGYADESKALIDEFRIKYKRKPAFVDELNKVKIMITDKNAHIN